MIWKWQYVQVPTLSPSILAADLAIIRLQADHHRSDGMSPITGCGWVDSPTVHGQSWACSWQCFNSQRWAKSKPKQHTATDNCILWIFDLFEFLAFLCFLGPNLRWRLAHLWEILIDPKQRLDGTFVLKQQKAPVVFQRLLDQFYAPFFWCGLRSTKNRLQMHLFDQQKICTGKGEKLRYLGKFHWRPV